MSVTQKWIAAILTLALFTYLWKENPVYRLAEHIMVGLAAAHGMATTWDNYLKPTFTDAIPKQGQYHLIIPAIQRKLKEMGANVADNVVASEKWYDFPLWFLLIPPVLGCSMWEISGQALLVEQPPTGESRAMAQHRFGDVWVFFQYGAR